MCHTLENIIVYNICNDLFYSKINKKCKTKMILCECVLSMLRMGQGEKTNGMQHPLNNPLGCL